MRRGRLILEMMPQASSPKKLSWRAWVMRLWVMNVSKIQRVMLEKRRNVTNCRPGEEVKKC